MLNKVGDVFLSGSSPWEGDPFERKSSGEILTRLIKSLDKSCVISLRGEWGSGKTVFLRRFGAHLERNSVRTIHIDAWKTDYLDDPMTAFISATNARIEKQVERDKTPSKHAEEIIRSLASAAVKIVAPATKLAGAVLLAGSDKVIDASADLVQDAGSYFLEKERSARSVEDDFKEALTNARNLLTGRHDNGPIRGHVAIIIDELDRCRPHYAVKVLERIKHFFSIPGLVFVIATDPEHLPNAIAAVYGERTNSETYLRKFVDFEYDLPEPTAQQYISTLADEFQLSTLCAAVSQHSINRARGPLSNDYKSMVDQYGRALDVAEVIDCFPKLASSFDLTLRDQAQAFTLLNAYLRAAPRDAVIIPRIFTLACVLRFVRPDLYRLLKKGRKLSELRMEQNLSFVTSPLVRETGFAMDVQAFAAIESAQDPDEKLHAGISSRPEDEREFALRDGYIRIRARVGHNAGQLVTFLSRSLTLADAFSGTVDDPY